MNVNVEILFLFSISLQEGTLTDHFVFRIVHPTIQHQSNGGLLGPPQNCVLSLANRRVKEDVES